MITPEDIRRHVIHTLLNTPRLGGNYVDWHSEVSNECGVTIKYPGGHEFEITIRKTK